MRIEDVFSQDTLSRLFPSDRADLFFDGIYGDMSEGAYDIRLVFKGKDGDTLHFEFQLDQRPGKCLVCSLTYGLPQVFSRHPVINIKGLIQEIEKLSGGQWRCTDWRLYPTREVSSQCHVIPLRISIS